jgi:hypothetical protein
METCGSTELEGLLLTARNLAKILTSIRRSLDSTSTSLSCPRIYPLYAAAAHDAVCTEAASAVASGFFMFLVLGLSLMTMMSLRASWYQNIKAEKVYLDESEVAENMIVDEHEEYLAYISKYKHEWQEYCGFDEKVDEPAGTGEEGSFSDHSDGSSYLDDEYRSDAEGYNGSMEGSDDGSEVSDAGGYQVTVVPIGSTKYLAQMDGTDSSVDISLPNFEAQESIASTSMDEEDLSRVPPPPPPPPGNPEYRRKDPASPRGRSFFDKYGIDPGTSARKKAATPPSRPPVDPPAAAPAAAAAPPPPPPADMNTHKSVQAQALPRRRSSPRSRGSLPSGRTFFKFDATNDSGVEIQLSDSPRYDYSRDPETMVFEY